VLLAIYRGACCHSSMVAVGPCRWWWGLIATHRWWCWVLIAIHRWWRWALIDGGGCSSPFIKGGVDTHCGLGRMLLPSSPFIEGRVGHWSLFIEGDCGCWSRVVVDAGCQHRVVVLGCRCHCHIVVWSWPGLVFRRHV